jgi:hypothetical protein
LRALSRTPDIRRNQVTNIKMLTAAAVLSAAIASPVFAQDANVVAPHHARVHHHNYRGSYNQINSPVAPMGENLGERDPSRVGGYDPSFNPPS